MRKIKKIMGLSLFMLVCTLCFTFNVKALDVTEDYTLENDSNEAIIVKSGSNVTINLNGKRLDVTGDAITIEEGAEAVITGAGNVNSTHGAIVNKKGEVTIENGNFNSTNWYTVKNMGKMTIKNGKFTQGDNVTSNASLIVNGWYDGKDTNENDLGVVPPTAAIAVLDIENGTFVHNTTTSTIKSDDWSVTNIIDGNFKSKKGYLIQATGKVNIFAGEFDGYKDIATFNANGEEGYEPGILNIYAGNFIADYIIEPTTSGILNIYRGTFYINKGVTDNSRYNKEYSKNILGGIYSIDISSDISEGYIIREDKENEYWVIPVYDDYKSLEYKDENGDVIATFESEKGMPIDQYLNVEKETLTEEVKNTVTISTTNKISSLYDKDKFQVKDTSLIDTYEITVHSGIDGQVIKISGTDFYKITLKVDPEKVKIYNQFKVIYLDENNEVKEVLDAVYEDGKISFKTTHLSKYAIVGYNLAAVNNVDVENPQTFDGIKSSSILGIISLLGLAGTGLYLKKENN